MEEDMMVCSRKFAEWLLRQHAKEDTADTDWLDVILRYCNASYDELLEEEMRKANQFYYRIEADGAGLNVTPSYELIRLSAGKKACAANFEPMNNFCDGYSVLTTCGAFPGKQQCPDYPRDRWEIHYLLDECVYQGNRVLKQSAEDGERRQILLGTLPEHIGKRNENLFMEDHFSCDEFIRANKTSFIDNQYPFSGGPSCPDRIISIGTYHNIIRAAALDCNRICMEQGIREEFREIFIVLLARVVLRTHFSGNEKDKPDFSEVFRMAEKDYREYIEEGLKGGKDMLDNCSKIRAFLNSGVRAVMDPMNDKTAKRRMDVRYTAIENKESALCGYISPQTRIAAEIKEQLNSGTVNGYTPIF